MGKKSKKRKQEPKQSEPVKDHSLRETIILTEGDSLRTSPRTSPQILSNLKEALTHPPLPVAVEALVQGTRSGISLLKSRLTRVRPRIEDLSIEESQSELEPEYKQKFLGAARWALALGLLLAGTIVNTVRHKASENATAIRVASPALSIQESAKVDQTLGTPTDSGSELVQPFAFDKTPAGEPALDTLSQHEKIQKVVSPAVSKKKAAMNANKKSIKSKKSVAKKNSKIKAKVARKRPSKPASLARAKSSASR